MSATRVVRVKQIVDAISSRLDCTQKVICSLIAVTQTSLSTAIRRPITEISENKVGRRLLSLLYVVETLHSALRSSSRCS